LFPVQVQGSEAAGDIVRAIERANRLSDCDVLIVGRGGGSLEDLWPFNEEAVARAIHASRIPVVSAVGHEVDVTIADFVADWRAPTPSAAAEKVSPDQAETLRALRQFEIRLFGQMQTRLRLHRQSLTGIATRLKHPGRRLEEQAQRLDELEQRLRQAQRRLREQQQQRLTHLQQRLFVRNPRTQIALARQYADTLHQRLQRATQQAVTTHRQRFAEAAHALHTLSPLATMSRGYAIVFNEQHQAIRRYDEVQPGARIEARLHEGRLWCRVEDHQAE